MLLRIHEESRVGGDESANYVVLDNTTSDVLSSFLDVFWTNYGMLNLMACPIFQG